MASHRSGLLKHGTALRSLMRYLDGSPSSGLPIGSGLK